MSKLIQIVNLRSVQYILCQAYLKKAVKYNSQVSPKQIVQKKEVRVRIFKIENITKKNNTKNTQELINQNQRLVIKK